MKAKEKEIVVPFLKWAGGKRWLTTAYPELARIEFERYIEPFVGSGAVFFHLAPKQAVLADQNLDLIDTYRAIKKDWRHVLMELRTHQRNHCKDYYYAMRDSKPRTLHTKAARFIYLNRTCWNGLYRVNLNGVFNVPIGTKQNVILDSDDFETTSRMLRDVELRRADFEETMEMSGRNDLVFVDPPYTVKHNYNGFIKYNEKLFSWDDQKRLRDCVIRAKARGAKIVVSNANHRSIQELYKDIGVQRVLARSSVLAADSANRGQYKELIIRC